MKPVAFTDCQSNLTMSQAPRQLLVSICICTLRRNAQLSRLLTALAEQSLLDRRDCTTTVVVVDNNPNADARKVVEEWAASSGITCDYRSLPRPGLADARNLALEEAAKLAEFALLLDDDEIPGVNWGLELLQCHLRTGAPIVIGPVRPALPENAPSWLLQGGFYDLPTFPADSVLSDGISGNALLHLPSIRDSKLTFDRRFNACGGEDQLFFRTARQHGLEICYAEKAEVIEPVPPERLRLGWLLRTRFRKGNTLGILSRFYPSVGDGRARRLLAVQRWLLGGTIQVCTGALRQRRSRMAAGVLDIAFGLGSLSGLCGFHFRAYGSSQVDRMDSKRVTGYGD